MKGFPLMASTLGVLQAAPMTLAELSHALEIGYISVLRLVNELKRSGLVAVVGSGFPRKTMKGGPAKLFGFVGGEALVLGRRLTRKFLKLWNAMLEPDSAAAIADDVDLQDNHVRRTIQLLRRLGLCHIADWQRSNGAGLPTALYMIGGGKDAPRPKRLTEQEYNRRANVRRKERKLFDALTWRVAA